MIKTKYGDAPKLLFKNYLGCLISKIFKILPLYEEESDTLRNYLESLQRELIGNQDLIELLENDSYLMSVLSKIQYLILNKDIDKDIYKKEVFSCITLVQKLLKKYFECEGDGNA